ncbi:MAG: hypothetical protein A3F74_14160 [Betaproteobacteria bacterium RIFCSPLOWO2_12_FULL_62_58]|nr:MAG: hypothetical protein A3F74_14160 [Betaproteobacteria bacterium RIFCSPLOWO2_12_FULL_62_58]
MSQSRCSGRQRDEPKRVEGRRSSREFSATALPQQVLSNLLWAAFGIDRPESNGRTAPSARDAQEIDIYVAQTVGYTRSSR